MEDFGHGFKLLHLAMSVEDFSYRRSDIYGEDLKWIITFRFKTADNL